jgi:hypothetical protein
MSSSYDATLGCLLDLQRSDGGWAYQNGPSWTEPTCYAILAVRSAGGPEQAVGRACEWLVRRQRKDGGWPPSPDVGRSTHVTSLAVLALTGVAGYDRVADDGVEWLFTQAGAETSLLARITRFAMGTQSSATDHAGWPWFPGAAAWVIPTSLAICALSARRRGKYGRPIAQRVAEARRFLWSRRCPDHGWNHGGLFRAGEMPVSYPETTGIALLALAGDPRTADLELSLRCGERHAAAPMSCEGENWLRLGLGAYGRIPASTAAKYRDWTVNQTALSMIAKNGDTGRNPFLAHE